MRTITSKGFRTSASNNIIPSIQHWLTFGFLAITFFANIKVYSQGLNERDFTIIKEFKTNDFLNIDKKSLGIPESEEIQGNRIRLTVVIVGGGGGAGVGESAGGGGAGKVQIIEKDVFLDERFEITIGNGGAGGIRSATPALRRGQNGEQTTLTLRDRNNQIVLEAISPGGGGGGVGYDAGGNQNIRNGNQGGSGGGAGVAGASENGNFQNGNAGNPQGISIRNPNNRQLFKDQKNINSGARGAGGNGGSLPRAGGGGGGAFRAGTEGTITGSGNSTNALGGNGGDGIELSEFNGRILGAGGGGTSGNANTNKPGLGGNGGGGNANNVGNGVNGLDNTGSGGGAGKQQGGNGGSGIVLMRFDLKLIPLPVEFAFFTGSFRRQERTLDLRWATAKEWENSHFEVQRSLDAGKSWEVLQEIQGQGYSDKPVDYKFTDENPPLAGGNVIYRLKQVDFDGTFAYSRVISVRVPGLDLTKGVWRAFPNPTTGERFNLELANSSEYQGEEIEVRLVSPGFGAQVFAGRSMREISSSIEQKLQKFSKGVYILEVQWGQKVEFIKVLKQ